VSKVRTPISKMKHTFEKLKMKLSNYSLGETNSKKESMKLLNVLYCNLPDDIARSDQTKIFHQIDGITLSFLFYFEDVKQPYIIVLKTIDNYSHFVSLPIYYHHFNFALRSYLKENEALENQALIDSLSTVFFKGEITTPEKITKKYQEEDKLIAIKQAEIENICTPFYSIIEQNEVPMKQLISYKEKEIKDKFERSEEFKAVQSLRLQLKAAEAAASKKHNEISFLYRPNSFNANCAIQEMSLTDALEHSILSLAVLFSNDKNIEEHALTIMIREQINQLTKAYSDHAIYQISRASMYHFIWKASKINSKMKAININKIQNIRSR